jgi:transcriptional regulator with XRE-family HTH domain
VTRKSKVGLTVESLGTYLREQRVAAELSLRQLAEQAGVSNPYLSQIERGLRRPSAEVLQALAKALRISAEQVYVQAGILNPDDDEVRSVELAILADPVLSERQKQALLETYKAFRAVSALTEPVEATAGQADEPPLADETRAATDVSAGPSGRTTPTEGS